MLYYKIDVLEVLKERGYSTYRIRKEHLLNEAQLTQIRAGKVLTREALEKLCRLTKLQPGDIIGYKD